MLNKLGTTEDMVIYHQNGKKSYEFMTCPSGLIIEKTFDKNEQLLIGKNSDGITALFTRDEYGHELAYKNTDGYYSIKDKKVTQEIYESFIQSLEKPKTVVELPSDEEIDKEAFRVPYDGSDDFYDRSFINGAKWMKERILNKNK